MAELGPQRTWMDPQVCGFNPRPERSPDGDCGKEAVIHIRLPTVAEGFIAACAEHKQFALRMPHRDHHRWSPWCEIPGTLWHDSPTPDDADSYCAPDDSGEEPVLTGRAELAVGPVAEPSPGEQADLALRGLDVLQGRRQADA